MIVWRNSQRYKLLQLHLRYEVDPRYARFRKAIRDYLDASKNRTE